MGTHQESNPVLCCSAEKGSADGSQMRLAQILAAKQLPASAAAIACITATQTHTSGFRTHPAAVDAVLHLAAAAGGKPGLRVPAAVGALLLRPTAVGTSWPAASQSAESSDGSVLCAYCLLGPKGTAGCVVNGLLAKPMRQAASSADSKAEEPLGEFLYEAEWQASGTAAVGKPVAQKAVALEGRHGARHSDMRIEEMQRVAVVAALRSPAPLLVAR